jgi:beta-glucosidase
MAIETFPPGFLWGAATAAYQIEGAAREGGRGESIWDRFSHTPGKTLDGATGDTACDHYHRFREDVALMKQLGLKAYRFSVSWPRIHPNGGGPANRAGIAFYNALIDELLGAGITPFVTLYHWDLPQALEDAGGWPNPDTAPRFADYAETCFRAFGDRVKHWITLNEPWCTAFLGYYNGEHAPGRKDLSACLQAGHTLLQAHGLAVRKFHEMGLDGKIGITDNFSAVHSASDRPEDAAAAKRFDAQMNRWFIDPLHVGEYPAAMYDGFGDLMPRFTDVQRALVQAAPDFMGVNYYTRAVIEHDPANPFLQFGSVTPAGAQVTEMGWEVYPQGLWEVLTYLRDNYQSPTLYVTENGAAFDDKLSDGGSVGDEGRRVYLRDHFRAAHHAITDGVRLGGYFVWSLMDNFEWAFGYSKRFGIVHTDYETQRRTPKASALWYSQVIRQNAVGDG